MAGRGRRAQQGRLDRGVRDRLEEGVPWYRGGAFHAGGDLDACATVGPTLYPLGNWN
jgi:hypothetical protein